MSGFGGVCVSGLAGPTGVALAVSVGAGFAAAEVGLVASVVATVSTGAGLVAAAVAAS